MAKTKYTPDQLEDNLLVEVSIECTKCRKGDMTCGEMYAADWFFEKGWRATPNHVYCPNCASKYLKQ